MRVCDVHGTRYHNLVSSVHMRSMPRIRIGVMLVTVPPPYGHTLVAIIAQKTQSQSTSAPTESLHSKLCTEHLSTPLM